MGTFVALDGGGTKTLCVVADERGCIRGFGQGGGANPNLVPVKIARDSVRDAVRGAWTASGSRVGVPRVVAISGPTVSGAELVVREITGAETVIRIAESRAAWLSVRPWVDRDCGLPWDVAVTVDAGTGSTACGWNREGQRITVGGWGWLLGDEGSGFWIGLQAVHAAIQAEDGRAGETSLLGDICDALSLGSLHELVPMVYQTEYGRYSIASLAPVVARAGRRGDAVAMSILATAGRSLAAMVTTIVRRLDIASQSFAVVPFGSVFNAGDLILAPFRAEVSKVAPEAQIVFPRYESVVGTLWAAMAHGEVDVMSIWSQIEAEATRYPRVIVGQGLRSSVPA